VPELGHRCRNYHSRDVTYSSSSNITKQIKPKLSVKSPERDQITAHS